MDEEIALYKQGMGEFVTFQKAGITFYEGIMNGKSVVLSKSGVGKVNASVCTQVLIDHFDVSQVIFTGVAGALNPALDIGDIVISKAAQQHDIDASALGFEKGTIPFAERSIFDADDTLIELARKTSEEVTDGKAMIGLILSGDQFIAGGTQAKELYERFNGYCTEMEGAAVAQVCHMNNIPYVIIRSMSDKADGSAHINFAEFTQLAAQRSYQIVNNMLDRIE